MAAPLLAAGALAAEATALESTLLPDTDDKFNPDAATGEVFHIDALDTTTTRHLMPSQRRNGPFLIMTVRQSVKSA